MMKARSARVSGADQAAGGSSRGAKTESLGANGTASQQAAAAQARKRRSSINVYDQPSSLNSRLRQLETDMLRLDEDRTKLFDDTHSALAQYELKLGEIHAILKSRQDNVEKYVGDMKVLLAAKEEFEKQTKLLSDKHDRIHEKFMHRETIISREIKLLKNKFEALEKNRHFRNMLSKSSAMSMMNDAGGAHDDLSSGLEGSGEFGSSHRRSEPDAIQTGEFADPSGQPDPLGQLSGGRGVGLKGVHIRMSKLPFASLGHLLSPLFESSSRRRRRRAASSGRRKSNRISALVTPAGEAAVDGSGAGREAETQVASHVESSEAAGPRATAAESARDLASPTRAARKANGVKIMGVRTGGTFFSRLFARTH